MGDGEEGKAEMTAPLVKLRTEAGTVWESNEKRFVQLGDHHWCGTNNEPEPVDDNTIDHVCRIWRVSEDQEWSSPEPVAPESQNPIDQLIQRVQLTGGDLEGNNIPVLAMLYQAKALEELANWGKAVTLLLEKLNATHMAAYMEDKAPVYAGKPAYLDGTVIQNRGGSTPLQTEAGGSSPANPAGDLSKALGTFPFMPGEWVCPPCKAGHHNRCALVAYDGRCNCADCNTEPGTPGHYATFPHKFQMGDGLPSWYCIQCGGGRLHPIHQTT